jgi:hypothetical protein
VPFARVARGPHALLDFSGLGRVFVTCEIQTSVRPHRCCSLVDTRNEQLRMVRRQLGSRGTLIAVYDVRPRQHAPNREAVNRCLSRAASLHSSSGYATHPVWHSQCGEACLRFGLLRRWCYGGA